MGRDAATGATVALGQSSAHLVFTTGYVELSAVHSDSPAHHLAPWLVHGPGLHILAFGTQDARADHARCEASGIRPSPLRQASREIAYGERHGEARFEWFMLPPATTPEGLVCLVRQLTPELVFQPAVQRHPNGATALAGVYLVAERPAEAARRYAAITGASSTAGEVRLADGWIRCLGRDEFGARFPGAAPVRVPALAGFAVQVASVDVAGRAMAAGAVAGSTPDGIWVAPGRAAGSVVEFVE